MREHRLVKRITRWRTLCSIAAVVVVAVGAALSSSDAQGRVDPYTQQLTGTVLNPDVLGMVTGGGTVSVTVTGVPTNVLASFGINGKRPPGFVQNGTGAALGRINYSKHAQVAGRHVNVPVTFMQVELSTTPSSNGTGGKAQLIGDCNQAGVECPTTPPGIQSVLVYVEDNSDVANTADVFQISFCTGVASVSPLGCGVAEGGPIRTGQIQIRPSASGGAPVVPTAASAPRLRP
jgi:hypothetical protein